MDRGLCKAAKQNSKDFFLTSTGIVLPARVRLPGKLNFRMRLRTKQSIRNVQHRSKTAGLEGIKGMLTN